MYCIPYLCYITWPKTVTVPVTSWELVPGLVGPRVLFNSWVAHAGAPGHFSFISTRKLRQRKAETFNFSPSSLPALLLQETAVSWQSQATSGRITQMPVCSSRTCRGGSCWFLVLSGAISSPPHIPCSNSNSKCSASAKRVQPDEEEAEKLSPQGCCCLSSRVFFPAAIVECVRRSVPWSSWGFRVWAGLVDLEGLFHPSHSVNSVNFLLNWFSYIFSYSSLLIGDPRVVKTERGGNTFWTVCPV